MTKLSRYPFYIVGGIAKAVDNAAAKNRRL
jgi:hypothetical protein|nr:MAG TPA: hypothetical protein [Caudoviricetes sp.]